MEENGTPPPKEVIELLNKLDAEQKAFEAYKAELLRKPLNYKHWVGSGKGL